MDIANCNLQFAKVKMLHFSFFILPFAILLISGCASIQIAGEVQAGRYALLTENPDLALSHFQRAAEIDPNYITDFTPLEQGVWTYVGRAHYNTGKLPEARKALERARSRYEDDNLARLYLGLTLARDGDRDRGLKEMEAGLRGMHGWLEVITYNTSYGQFWDPGEEIRREIQTNLAMISGRDINWQRLIAGGEWVGEKMEEEIDLAERDETEELFQDGDDDGEEP